MKRLEFGSPATMERPAKWARMGAFQVINQDPTGFNEGKITNHVENLSFGRPLAMTKMERLTTRLLKYRYHNLCQWNTGQTVNINAGNGVASGSGFPALCPLLNHTTSVDQGTRAPMWIFSLTSAPQLKNTTTLNKKHGCCVPFIPGVLGTSTTEVRFMTPGAAQGAATPPQCPSLQGRDVANIATNGWYEYNVGNNTYAPFEGVGPSAVLERSDIKLQLYGTVQRPTLYRVMLVQFDEDNVPLIDTSPATDTSGLVLGYSTGTGQGLFWLNWMRKLAENPDWTGTRAQDAGMRILYQRYINIEPDSQLDADATPNMHRLRLGVAWHRKVNYNWQDTETALSEAAVSDGTWNRRANDIQMDVERKARIYLVVTAGNYTSINTGSGGTITTPVNTIPSFGFDVINSWRVPA